MNIEAHEKAVLITGGTGSLGMALVQVYCQAGSRVQFQYHTNVERARSLEKSFGAKAFIWDFRQPPELPEPNFDILINNAGINLTKQLSIDVQPEEWDDTISVNVTTPYHLIRLCLPYMLKNGWGRIININSIWGMRGSIRNLPYNAAKHGLSGITKTIAKEYGSNGITCNEICPGPIESELMDKIAAGREKDSGIPKEEYFRDIRELIPDQRFATPLEIAQLALYLSSDYAGHINGASIPIDGGYIA